MPQLAHLPHSKIRPKGHLEFGRTMRRIVVSFDDKMFSVIEQAAHTNGISFSEEVRRRCMSAKPKS
jgi:hypothetical protein